MAVDRMAAVYKAFGSLETNIGYLNYFDRFPLGIDPAIPPFRYIHDDPGLLALRQRCSLDPVGGDGNEWTKLLNIMHWVHGVFRPGGAAGVPYNSMALLEYAFDHDKRTGLACDQYATVLTELYRCVGFKSRLVVLLPFNPNQAGNHAVVIVWSENANKWFMLDPQYNAYYADENGAILSPWEIRDRLVHGRPIVPSQEYDNYGHAPEEVYRIYLAKCLFSMTSPIVNGFGNDPWRDRAVHLHPMGYDPAYRHAKFERWSRKAGGEGKTDSRIDPTECEEPEHTPDWILTSSTESFAQAPT